MMVRQVSTTNPECGNQPAQSQSSNTDIENVKFSDLVNNGVTYRVTYCSIRDGDYGRFARVLLVPTDDESKTIGTNIGGIAVLDKIAKTDEMVGKTVFFESKTSASGKTYSKMVFVKETA